MSASGQAAALRGGLLKRHRGRPPIQQAAVSAVEAESWEQLHTGHCQPALARGLAKECTKK